MFIPFVFFIKVQPLYVAIEDAFKLQFKNRNKKVDEEKAIHNTQYKWHQSGRNWSAT